MHAVCLGVMKKFLQFWLKPTGPGVDKSKVLTMTALINDHLSYISDNHYCPTNFARYKPRTFHHLPNFKATEFRQILLYTGVVIFCNKLPKRHLEVMVNINVIFRMLSQLSAETELYIGSRVCHLELLPVPSSWQQHFFTIFRKWIKIFMTNSLNIFMLTTLS